jgi:hypothetical protein
MEPNHDELDTQSRPARIDADDFCGVAPSSQSTPRAWDDGLHVSRMEQSITARRIEDVVAADGEVEVENAESENGGGFQRYEPVLQPKSTCEVMDY